MIGLQGLVLLRQRVLESKPHMEPLVDLLKGPFVEPAIPHRPLIGTETQLEPIIPVGPPKSSLDRTYNLFCLKGTPLWTSEFKET